MARKPKPPLPLGSVIDHLFSSQAPFFALSDRLWNPPTDIYDCGGKIVIKMEIPGVSPENLSITAQGRTLIVQGRRDERQEEAIASYHLMEVRYGEFERTFEFPFRISMDKIEASCDDGFLRVTIPRRPTGGLKVPILAAAEQSEE